MTAPVIYVFCNSCEPGWHSMMAMAEDGHVLAGHVCSAHGFAAHDMGIHEEGWKRDKYAAHYPDGFTVEWVEDPRTHAGLQSAYAKNQELAAASEEQPCWGELAGDAPNHNCTGEDCLVCGAVA